jgi:PEP-CTERM motif
MKSRLFTIVIALFCVSGSLPAAVTSGNWWHNPTFEAGTDPGLTTGTPEFWNRGGSDASINQWSMENSVSATHSLAVVDNNTSGFGEWYSDLPLAGIAMVGETISLHWYELYSISIGGEMRVTVRFLDAGGNGPDNHFVVMSNSPGWGGTIANSTFGERNQDLVVTPGAVTLRIQLASGGSELTTGVYLIDDLSVVPEPSTLALLSGLVGFSGLFRRRKIAR